MRAKQLAAPLLFSYRLPSSSLTKPRQNISRVDRAFIQSDAKQRMFSDDYMEGTSDSPHASDDPYSESLETFSPGQSMQRTGKKQRWRNLRREEHANDAYSEHQGPSSEDAADANDNWRIRGFNSNTDRPSWARASWARASNLDETIGSRWSPQPRSDHRDSSPCYRPPSPSPPPAPSTSNSPSAEYLAIAASPSSPIDPAPRKLLILDLNGTLLVRTSSRGSIHDRPYMPALRAYLFAAPTRAWLDVMVWSSAQPHNVDRMVARSLFGRPPPQHGGVDEDDKWDGKLAAVWARDTLGLSAEDYSRKSATTKDLEKPWSALPGDHNARTTLLLDDSPAKARLQPYNHVCISEYSLKARDHDLDLKRAGLLDAIIRVKVASPVLGEKKDGSEAIGGTSCEEQGQSAELTLKGITENEFSQSHPAAPDSETPVNGIASAAAMPFADPASSPAPANHTSLSHHPESHSDPLSASSPTNIPAVSSSTPSRSYFKPPFLLSAAAGAANAGEEWHTARRVPDETLLAVIGILDALRVESNVAGWVRAGGLRAGRAPPASPTSGSMLLEEAEPIIDAVGASERPPSPTDLEVEDAEPPPRSSSPALNADTPATTETPAVRDTKRQRSEGTPGADGDGSGSPKRVRSSIDGPREDVGIVDAPAEKEAVEKKKEEVEDSFIIPGFHFTAADSRPEAAPIEILPTEDDTQSLAGRTPSGNDDLGILERIFASSNHAPGALPENTQKAQAPIHPHVSSSLPMWYEDPEIFGHWVQRGREVLRELGIEEDDGISPV